MAFRLQSIHNLKTCCHLGQFGIRTHRSNRRRARFCYGYSGNIGYYSLMLTIICFGVSLVFRDYMVVSLRNAAAFIAAVSTALIGIHFLLFYLIAGKGEAGYYFLNHYISRIIYTIITGIGLYFLNRALYKGLRD